MNNKRQRIVLSIIFVALMIPTVILYIEHSILELEESGKSAEQGSENKSIRQFGEGVFFGLISIGYIVTTALVFVKPNNVISYYVILVGTVAIVIVYYFRTITGIPVLGTDLIIKDYTTDFRDVITKITQQAFVIPLAMMLQKVYDTRTQRE